MRLGRVGPLVVMAAIAGTGGPAAAQTTSDAPGAASSPPNSPQNSPDAHFKAGVQLFKEADFRSALVEFRRAYDLAPNWRVLYNVAQCQYQLVDYVAAKASFERYLAEGRESVPPARRAEVEGELSKIQQRIAEVTIRVTPTEATVMVDDVAVGKSPLAKAILVNPGVHRISAERSDADRKVVSVEVTGAEKKEVAIDLVVRANEAPSPAVEGVPERRTSPVPFFVGAGVLGAVGVTFGVLALGAQSTLKAERGAPQTSPAKLTTLDNRVGNFALVTDVAIGVGLVSAGFGVYFTLAGRKGPDSAPPASPSALAVRVRPGLMGVVTEGTF